MAIDFQSYLERAAEIRDEKDQAANTAERVGGLLVDFIEEVSKFTPESILFGNLDFIKDSEKVSVYYSVRDNAGNVENKSIDIPIASAAFAGIITAQQYADFVNGAKTAALAKEASGLAHKAAETASSEAKNASDRIVKHTNNHTETVKEDIKIIFQDEEGSVSNVEVEPKQNGSIDINIYKTTASNGHSDKTLTDTYNIPTATENNSGLMSAEDFNSLKNGKKKAEILHIDSVAKYFYKEEEFNLGSRYIDSETEKSERWVIVFCPKFRQPKFVLAKRSRGGDIIESTDNFENSALYHNEYGKPRQDVIYEFKHELYRYRKGALYPVYPRKVSLSTDGIELKIHGSQQYTAVGLIPYLFRLSTKQIHPRSKKLGKGWIDLDLGEGNISIERGWHRFSDYQNLIHITPCGTAGLVNFYTDNMAQHKFNDIKPINIGDYSTKAVTILPLKIRTDKYDRQFVSVKWGKRFVDLKQYAAGICHMGRFHFGIGFGRLYHTNHIRVTPGNLVSNLAEFTVNCTENVSESYREPDKYNIFVTFGRVP